MSQKVTGNTRSLAPSLEKLAHRLFSRRVDPHELVPFELAREITAIGQKLSRRVGVLINREGRIEEVFLGTKDILYLPDLGRYRLGSGRLRRLRLIFSDLSSSVKPVSIPSDILGDLEKLRLDCVVAVKETTGGGLAASYAHLAVGGTEHSRKEFVPDLGRLDLDFLEFIATLEEELAGEKIKRIASNKQGAVLIAVSDKSEKAIQDSFNELKELARTAGVEVIDTIVQRKKPDPKSVLGKGKLEEVTLQCLRLGAEVIVFDTELRPSQWRAVTNSTELKVLDRSMIILDIFAQRAQSSEGRLQVELAQLSYNLPRLSEQDAGLSRLSGGIGGRGPGETKLEISRRRARDRITELEHRIDDLSSQRSLKKSRRKESGMPLVSIIGYTNVGKSTLFNRLSNSTVIAENKLFATLDTYQRKIFIGHKEDGRPQETIISDTVGFIRDLPKELKNAFRATLEEVKDATILLHVVDASDPLIQERIAAVHEILAELEVIEIPMVIVLNKIDLLSAEELEAVQKDVATLGKPILSVSAEKGTGIIALRALVQERLGIVAVEVTGEVHGEDEVVDRVAVE